MKGVSCVLYILATFYWNVYCELTAREISNLVAVYKNNVDTSIALSQTDKAVLSMLAEEHQVKLVNVTTNFRLQMIKHKDHNFKKASNIKWNQCIDVYSNDVERSEHLYFDGEVTCLRKSNEASKKKRRAVDQIEREIKNWRKSYKYMSHLCEINNSNDKAGTKACLVEYIEKDDYNSVFVRLMELKYQAMQDLYDKLVSTIATLQECLRVVLTDYVNKVRSVMGSLDICYNGKKKE